MEESKVPRAPRHKGKLPVTVRETTGVTRDFSNSGVFFETDASLCPGQAIDFTILLAYADMEGPIRMKCRGEIVRVEGSGKKIGVAATIDTFSFEEIPQEER